jgi:hypothetical protein
MERLNLDRDGLEIGASITHLAEHSVDFIFSSNMLVYTEVVDSDSERLHAFLTIQTVVGHDSSQ